MDILLILHIILFFIFVSIPFWPLYILRFGVYIPLIISFIWLLFDGCPLTKMHADIDDDGFTRQLYSYIISDISKKQVNHINTFALIAITVIGFQRLCALRNYNIDK